MAVVVAEEAPGLASVVDRRGEEVPSPAALAIAMKIAASAYLLYLAWQVAGAGAHESGTIARPMSVRQAIAFQAINPKGWIFALGAITAFRPADLPVMSGSLLVAATMTAVVIPTAAIWGGAGEWLGRLLDGERSRRFTNVVLAGLLALSVASIWM